MNSILETLPQIAAYQPTLIALALLCLAILIQGVLIVPLGFANGTQQPGMSLQGGHADLSFRVLRTYGNSVESFPTFFVAVFLAIIAGIDANWVNWLAGLHVTFRIIYWGLYYKGIGKISGGPRSLVYAAGWLMNVILAGMGVYGLITG